MPLIPIIGPLFTHDPSPSQLIVRTGAEQTRVVKEPTKVILEVAIPLLAGPDFEVLGSGADLSRHGRLHLLHRPGMIAGVGLADRGTFVVDPDGVIQLIEITPEGVGRNAAELVRKIKAAKYWREHPGQVCPAKWEEGGETLAPSIDLVGKI